MKHISTWKLNINLSTITDVFLDQKRVNVCEHMIETAPPAVMEKCHQTGRETGREGGVEGKLNENHLRLLPWLCLEDRKN